MLKRLLKRITSYLEFRRFRRLQNARATSIAVNMALTGALRRTP